MMKKIIIIAMGFCFTSIFGMITQQEQPALPSCQNIENGIDFNNKLIKDTTLACFLCYSPKNTQEPVFFTNTIQQPEQDFQQEQQPKKMHGYKKRKIIKELPNHIINTNDECYCTLCKKRFTSGSAHKHASSKIHQVNQLYGDNIFKIKLNTPIACCELTCNKHFTDIDDWLAHMFSNHTIDNRDCGICGKKFKYMSNVKRHFYTHLKLNFYTCPGCKETFKVEGELVKHLKKCTTFNEMLLNA